MPKITFNDIFKLLPISSEEASQWQAKYEQLDEAHKLEYQIALWNIFHEYKTELENLEYQTLLDEVGKGERKLTGAMDIEAKKRVRDYFQQLLSGETSDKKEIDEIREKLKAFSN